MKSEGIKISDKSVYNILKKKTTGTSLTSIEEEGFSLNNPVNNSFDESFSDNDARKEIITKPINTLVFTDNEEEEEKEIQIPKTLISLINQGVKEGTEQVKSMLSPQKTNDDYLDDLINKTKKTNKPMPVNKLPNIIPFNTDGMTESEKRLRRDMIIKIRNYIDCFSDNEIIQSICGNPVLFKQRLYEKDLASLTIIYEEIQIGINQSKDFEQFMYMFSSGLQITEFVSSILLGMNIAGLKDDLLTEISEFDLKQLACELSLSRYISPQKRIMLITLKVLLKKILSNDLLGKHKDLKIKLLGYYNSMSRFLGK